PIGQRGSVLPSSLRRRHSPRRHVDDCHNCRAVNTSTTRIDPPFPPNGLHFTANKAPTFWR
ncbi:hypothetical protein PoB_005320000, partial [Plakobranchus ocellatus]